MSPARSRFARLLSFPEQSWRHAMQYNKRTATTFPAQDAGMMAGLGRVVSEEHTQDQDKNYRPANPYLKGPASPNLRNPADCVGTSSFGYGGNMAGDASRKASLESPNLGRAGNVHDMRSTSSDAQGELLGYGSNAGVVSRDSTALPLDRGPSRPDAASSFQQRPQGRPYAASFVNQRPQGELSRDVMSFQKGDMPRQHDLTPCAEEYNVRKARVHASLWQQEMKKQAGEATSVEGNPDAELSDSFSDTRVGKESSGWDPNKTMPEDWETFDPSEGQFYDDSPGKEEAMMFEEFDKRRERNRILIASFVKQHLYGRRRPVDGWKYILNNFGLENKGEKGSALGGRQMTGNDLEKLALKSESRRLRRKD
eukprot:c15174_g2_i1 orf=158-1261(+)